jgi:GNAT superfamily N-acetyltransferase
MVRHEYRLTLQRICLEPPAQLQPQWELRHPIDSDREALAALVLSAYRGTIDDEGEDLDGARAAVAESFERSPLLHASWIVSAEGVPVVSAVLLRRWHEQPLVTFVVTEPAYQGRRIASVLVQGALRSLLHFGERQAVAFITEGNIPSERLFARLGFQRVPPPPDRAGAAR